MDIFMGPEEQTSSRHSVFIMNDNQHNLLWPCITQVTYYMYRRSNYGHGLLGSLRSTYTK